MRRAGVVLGTMVMVMVMAAGVAAGQTEWAGSEYIIGPGDVLDISVWKVEELTKLVTVLPDGKIAFPLVGQIPAAGRTVAQLGNELQKKLARFVPDLNLSVVVHQVNSMMIYVIGRVHKPGRFVLNADINVLQALTMAGGLNQFAKEGKIKIFRQEQKGTEIIRFDYDDVIQGKDLAQNIVLRRGDVIVVP